MKILITNFHLIYLAGLELFTISLAIELKKRGHEVFVFIREAGPIAEKIKKTGIFITDNLDDFKNIKFDIIHAHHNITAILTRAAFPKVPMIFMAHGVLVKLDNPPPIDIGIDKYIATSEGIKKHLITNHGIFPNDIEIVKIFIDFKRFASRKELNVIPKNLLFLSNHDDKNVIKIIKDSCQYLGIKYTHVGLPENSMENVEDYINDADIVVTLGKGALEAMACERNVIVYDINGGDGMITKNNFFEIMRNNFSGRTFRQIYSKEAFIKEIKKYDKERGGILKTYVEKEYNADRTITKLEKIYLDAINLNVAPEQRSKKINSAEFSRLAEQASKNYLLKTIHIRIKDMPYLAFRILKKYGLNVFLHKTLNYYKAKFGNNRQCKNIGNNTVAIVRDERKPKIQKKVSIIVPFCDKSKLLENCLASILNKTQGDFEIILVDNNSQEEKTKKYLDIIGKKQNVRIIKYKKPFNFSAINNFAAKQATGEFLLFLNNDTEVISVNWLEAMLEQIQNPKIGAVGAKLFYPDGKIQHAGITVGENIAVNDFNKCREEDLGEYDVVRTCDAVTGACLMTKKELFLKLGGFDEVNLPVAYNDVAYCLRLKELGFLTVWTPDAKLYHIELASRKWDSGLWAIIFNHKRRQQFLAEQEYIRRRWAPIGKENIKNRS